MEEVDIFVSAYEKYVDYKINKLELDDVRSVIVIPFSAFKEKIITDRDFAKRWDLENECKDTSVRTTRKFKGNWNIKRIDEIDEQ